MRREGALRGRAASQELVLFEVHPLDDIAAVIEHPADILRVHCAGEVRVTVVFAVPCCRADPLQKTRYLHFWALAPGGMWECRLHPIHS